jgi:hypothetical protein
LRAAGRLTGPAAVLEGGAGAAHGGVDVGALAADHVGQEAAVHRRMLGKGLAVNGRHALAVDHGTAIGLEGLGPFSPVHVVGHGVSPGAKKGRRGSANGPGRCGAAPQRRDQNATTTEVASIWLSFL